MPSIIGGGPTGSCLALVLLEFGLEVEVFEMRPGPGEESVAEQRGDRTGRLKNATRRSINLALSHRGIEALKRVGAAELVLSSAVEMHSRFVHLADGTTATQRYGGPNEAIYSVSRQKVVKILAELAEQKGAVFRYGEKLRDLDPVDGSPRFVSGRVASKTPTFGCDGAFSATRRAMERRGRFETKTWYATQGYKELAMPADGNQWALPKNYLHIWPRGDDMLIALPNTDGSFTATLFAPIEDLEQMETSWPRARVEAYFQTHFPDALKLMPGALDDFYANPTSPLLQLTINPWHLSDTVLCLGDASHAVVPFYGQGMNAALEDCLVFAEILDRQKLLQGKENSENNHVDFAAAFRAVSDRRRKSADGLSELATMNYRDMASNTASRIYRFRKALERLVARYAPALWRPQYSMVTFSRIPYDAVLRRHFLQERFLTGLSTTLLLAASSAAALFLSKLLGVPNKASSFSSLLLRRRL